MSYLNNTTIEGNSSSLSNYEISPLVRFWSYLFLDIISILCTLFVLYYLLFDRTHRQALHNHIIIVLLFIGLIYELTDIPWILYYNYWDIPMFSTITFYLIWVFVDYAFYSAQIALFAWATVERHILIFHDKWISTRKKRFFIHYVPIAAIPIYCFIYYCFIYFRSFCENSFDSFIAGGIYIPCLFSRTILGSWDLIVHQVIPTLTIVIFSFLLILRVILQKKRLNQPIKWRRHRKMTIQLLSISCIYLLFNFPWTFLVFAFQYGLPADVAYIPLLYAGYTVAAKIIRTTLFLMNDGQNTDLLRFDRYQKNRHVI
ncbi:unnamed protein product [Rotaria sp. Silwood1]|nr:unnamed protein product [Rotaria sp. Silwood1]